MGKTSADQHGEAPGRWAELFAPSRLLVTLTLCFGIAQAAFNTFLVTTALPTAVAEIGGERLMAPALVVFLVFAIIGGALAAALKQRFGARTVMIGASLLFASGSVLAGAAGSMELVVFARALQGAGEGVVAALCYALIPELYPQRLVPKIFGAEAFVWAVSAFGGPVLAGFLTEHISWRAAFYANVPMSIAFLAMVIVAVPPGDTRGRVPTPLLRLVLLGAGLTLTGFADYGPTPPMMFAALAAGLAALVAAVLIDARAPLRLLPAGAFSFATRLGNGLWTILLMPAAEAASAVYIVYGLQNVWGLRPTLAGAVAASLAIAWSLTAITVASLPRRVAPGHLIIAGAALLLAGVVLQGLGFHLRSLTLVVGAHIIMGSAFGMNWAYLSQGVMNAAPPGERDRAAAMAPTLQNAGYALGAAMAGLVAQLNGFASHLLPATLASTLAATILPFALPAVAALFTAMRFARLQEPSAS